MKVKLEDEAEGVTWRGYVSIEIVDDAGDVVVDANVALEWVPDATSSSNCSASSTTSSRTTSRRDREGRYCDRRRRHRVDGVQRRCDRRDPRRHRDRLRGRGDGTVTENHRKWGTLVIVKAYNPVSTYRVS